MLDLMMGDEPWLNATTGCSFPEPWKTPDPIPDSKYVEAENTTVASPGEYLGNYTSKVFPMLSVEMKDDKLTVSGFYISVRLYPPPPPQSPPPPPQYPPPTTIPPTQYPWR